MSVTPSVRRLLFALLLCGTSTALAQTPPAPITPPNDGIAVVLRQVERALETDDLPAFTALLAPETAGSDEAASFTADWFVPGVTRAVVRERQRAPAADLAEGLGYDVFVDVLNESGREGRVSTWQIALRRARVDDAWRITGVTVLTTMNGLYRLDLNPAKQFAVTNLTLNAEDLTVRLPQGSAFVAETDAGVTAIVLIGRGDITFTPAPAAEKGQVRIYSGAETLETTFDWLYVRVNPAEFDDHIAPAALTPSAVDPRSLRRANAIFADNVALAFGLDLADLSRERWSTIPKFGDMITEIDGRRAHLTYMRSSADAEDIRFFDRTHQRTIAIYASKDKLAARGPYYDEDDQTDYDILNYDVTASFDPDREWIDGSARVLIAARKAPVSSITMNLAESLVIRSVVSNRFGYLMALRVSGQNDVVVNLPEALPPNTVLDLTFSYGGRLHATPLEREALDLAQNEGNEYFTIPIEPSYVYTGRSFWYPQGPVTDYASANLALRVPGGYQTVATGTMDEGFPKTVMVGTRPWTESHYSATQPVRYLAWAISRFVHVDSATVELDAAAQPEAGLTGAVYHVADVSVESTGMLRRRALELSATTQDAMKFYGTLLGDLPYQSFTLAVVERNVPGGHSPPYFAALSQPPPATPIAWRNDPAYFDGFPEFFVAHEVAHQWWGQGVGWKNYHEQWLSEGFAQYFAALYAERSHGKAAFDRVIAQMARWAVNRSDQGPVYLGYRLGHIKNDARVFRALVYNKGGIVLHMLRRLMGDEAFFRAIRRFYASWRFKKAGTADVKAAFQAETTLPLDRFFERWIQNADLPRLKFSYRTEPDAVIVRFEQIGEIFDVPVTVTLEYPDSAPPLETTVAVTDRVIEQRIPTPRAPRNVVANEDDATPAIFVR